MVRKPHEDAVEPHLIAVDGLVPEHPILLCARLVLQLTHQLFHGEEVLGFRVVLIHPRHEMACADVVEVVIFQLIATDITLHIDHCVGVGLAIVQ